MCGKNGRGGTFAQKSRLKPGISITWGKGNILLQVGGGKRTTKLLNKTGEAVSRKREKLEKGELVSVPARYVPGARRGDGTNSQRGRRG